MSFTVNGRPVRSISFGPNGEQIIHDPRTLDDAKAENIERIKLQARQRILDVAPEWKQVNLTARAAELALRSMTGGPTLTAEELAEVAAGAAVWEEIKAIRAASGEAEARVLAAATNAEADAVEW